MKHAEKIFNELLKAYPDAHCELIHGNPFELLMATILSAQCTDVRVNQVTPELFRKFPNANSMSKADIKKLEELIRPTGFYKNKAKNISQCTKALVKKHEGEVPDSMESLTALSGVGRKTANVILSNAFNINEGVVVDTHVKRLSNRLGLSKADDPLKIEQDLMKLFKKSEWGLLSHLLIFHGRRVCKARKPECDQCPLKKLCPEGKSQ